MDTRTHDNFDGMCRAVIEKCGINGGVSWFLMASLLYYHADLSLLSDQTYDRLAKDLLADFDKLTNNQKWIIGEDALKAGSAYHLKIGHYPHSTRGAALTVIVGRGWIIDPKKREEIYYTEFEPPEYCWDTYTYGPRNETWRQFIARTRPEPVQPVAPPIRQRTRVRPTGENA